MSLWTDAKNMAAKDPAAKSTLQVILLYSGFFYSKIAARFRTADEAAPPRRGQRDKSPAELDFLWRLS